MNRYILIILLLLISGNIYAHEDTIISMSSEGGLEGLPKKYSPANFNISTWTLSVADSQFTFPSCVSSRYPNVKAKEFLLAGSWYHPTFMLDDINILRMPDYLSISIESRDFSVLVSLATAKPFNVGSSEFVELNSEEICELL